MLVLIAGWGAVRVLDALGDRVIRLAQLVFDDSYAVDRPAQSTVVALLTTSLPCIGLSVPVFRNDARESRFYALLLFALLRAVMLAGANDAMEILRAWAT